MLRRNFFIFALLTASTPDGKYSCQTHTFDNHTQRLVLPSFPLFGGEQGFTLASLHTFCLCPLAFASVSCCFEALFSTQHRHRPVVYPATSCSKFYASYRSLWHGCRFTSTCGPGPISIVSVKFCQAVAYKTTENVSAERHAPYNLFEPTMMKWRPTSQAPLGRSTRSGLTMISPFRPPIPA
jgi:hypothetical protein